MPTDGRTTAVKTVVGGNITTEEEATAESHQPHMLLPPSTPRKNMQQPIRRSVFCLWSTTGSPDPEDCRSHWGGTRCRGTLEKFGDCVTLSPVCVRATKAESNFHICYKQENGSYDSVIKCVDTHTRKLDSSSSSLT